jgi:acyl phosphate:glycerol-3-phosphate acyltransferase
MQNIDLIILLISVIYYFIGSIPIAFIVLKLFHNKDIRLEGSGNVGAMNSYDITGSKKTGIIVFILDFLKGAIPALIPLFFLDIGFDTLYIPLAALVAGHNFSIWLKFKGGRGLATAAGILMVVNFWIVVIWCVIFVISNLIKKDVHIGNIAATILMPVVLIVLNSLWKNLINNRGINSEDIIVFCVIICILILLKHISPIVSLIKR